MGVGGIIYTGEELIRSVRRTGVIARAGTDGVKDWDILMVLSEIMWTKMIPRVMKLREDYFLVKTRQALVSGTTEYRLPARTLLNKLGHVYLWDGDNHLDPQKAEVQGVYLVVSDADSDTGYDLEMQWYFRPGAIDLSANCREVKAVNAAAKTIQLASNPPASWGSASTVDVHSKHSGAEIKLWDKAVTISTDTLTFASAIDGSTYGTHLPEVGDWVCLAGWAALPGLPSEYHPALAALTAYRFAIASGDDKAMMRLAKDLDPELRELLGATDVRIDRKPQRISLYGTPLFPSG